jgi:hypothetical protein
MKNQNPVPFVFKGVEHMPVILKQRQRDEGSSDEVLPIIATTLVINQTTKVTCVESEATDRE